MSQKQKEIAVDDLLQQLEGNSRSAKDTNQKKEKKVDDWGNEEEQYTFQIAKNDPASGKSKNKPKKATVKGWGEFEQEQTDVKPTPEKEEFTEVADQPKKKMFKKPTGDSKPAPVDLKVNEEYFPSLGEEPPKNMPKKEEPRPQPQPTQNTTSTGPRRFMNTKKDGSGETFAPIEVKEKEVPQPQPQKVHVPTFQRGTEKPQEKVEEPVADGKIKFGTEGPKRFIGASKTHKKEEEKSEVELLREQKEREVEEKLQKEREELAKEIEARKARKAALEHKKPEEGKERPPRQDKQETHVHHDKPHHDSDKKEHHENGENKRIPKLTNSKKTHENHAETKPTTTTKEPETQPEDLKAKETEIVVTNASSKEWGEGGIMKKSKKKV